MDVQQLCDVTTSPHAVLFAKRRADVRALLVDDRSLFRRCPCSSYLSNQIPQPRGRRHPNCRDFRGVKKASVLNWHCVWQPLILLAGNRAQPALATVRYSSRRNRTDALWKATRLDYCSDSETNADAGGAQTESDVPRISCYSYCQSIMPHNAPTSLNSLIESLLYGGHVKGRVKPEKVTPMLFYKQ